MHWALLGNIININYCFNISIIVHHMPKYIIGRDFGLTQVECAYVMAMYLVG